MTKPISKMPPIFIFDGNCGFCRRWVELWRSWTGDRVEYLPSQERGDRFPQVSDEILEESVILVEADGTITQEAEAVFRALGQVPAKAWLLSFYQKVPGFAAISNWLYRRVANHRMFFSKILKGYVGKEPSYHNYYVARRVFLAFLGLIYLTAFLSYGSQITGLIGAQGILPVGEFLAAVQAKLPGNPYLTVPTIFWIHHGDVFLQVSCWVGAFLSLLLILGWGGVVVTLLLWVLYLSLYSVGQVFLSFQWDILLLEMGFLAIFLTPLSWRPNRALETQTSNLVLWLYRLLLFRLMIQSGMAKILSQDPTWRDGTAMTFHYWTQPLPHGLSYWAHQLPEWFQRQSTFGMFFIELVVPFFIFFPSSIRRVGAMLMMALQILIILTGNYGFFNYLTLALCVLLIADRYWPTWLKNLILKPSYPREKVGRKYWPRWIIIPVALWILFMSFFTTWRKLDRDYRYPPWFVKISRPLAPFHLVNSYGLFARMTKSRPEISVEGSRDGVHWTPYTFKYKVGDLKRRPAWVPGHMPRLDWQMWFAGLRPPMRYPYWFERFMGRLLEGSFEVLGLLAQNPFPDGPPRYVRARVANYYFADREVKALTGEWWAKGEENLYAPVYELRGGNLIRH